MAGIGFSLRRLFGKKGILNLCRAYGYSSIVTIGPTFLGVALLIGVSFVARIGGMEDHERDLLNCLLTYSLLVALFVTTWFNMVVTRYVSDMIYDKKEERVMQSFFGTLSIELVICLVLYGTYLFYSGVDPIRCLLSLWLAMVLIVVWTEMIYMTALRDFQAIVMSFAISLMIGFLLALLLVLLGHVSLENMLVCVTIAYGILAVRYLKLMLDYFPRSEGSHFSFLSWFNKYPTLAFSGGLVRLGLFSHIVIMYFGPLRVQVEGNLYSAPEYDVPALLAFFSMLITTVGFVVSMEVNFYPKYSNYYGLFNDRGGIKDIKLAEKEMVDMLQREFIYLGCKQIFATVLFIFLGPPLINLIIPGLSSLSLMIYKFLCVGYGIYALANSIMLIQLYFEDYFGAFIGTALFAIITTGMSIWQILYGDVRFFGMAFVVGSAVFYFFALLRLDWYRKRLPYFLLSRQSLIPGTEKGLFVKISRYLEERYEKKKTS